MNWQYWLPCKNCKHQRHNHFYIADYTDWGKPIKLERLKNCDAEVNFHVNCGCRNWQEMTNLEFIEYESERMQVVQEDVGRTQGLQD